MKKWMAATLLVVSLIGSAYAGNTMSDERILGIEVASATIEADTFGLGGENNHEGDDVEFGVRLGAQNDEWRTLLILDYFDSSDDDQSYWKGLVTVDYMILKEGKLKPFIGVNVGYIDYDTSLLDVFGDGSGLMYGGQAGVLFRINEHLQADVQYRYSFSSADSVNHTEGILFGIEYIFR
jgi:opacity protein-like surface antigen